MKLTLASSYAIHAIAYMAQSKQEGPIASHKVADLQRSAMRGPGSTAVASEDLPEKPDDSLGPEERAVLSSDAEWAKALLAKSVEST